MKIRRIIFWLHLVVGIVVGLVVFMLCLTGVILTFEKEIVNFADRNSYQTSVSDTRLPLAELLDKAKAAQPDKKPSSLTVESDPRRVVQISYGRGDTLLVDPSSGELREQGATGIRSFLRFNLLLHRWLVLEGDSRVTGKAVTGACTLAFLFLAISGLWLWWPRRWSWRSVKSIIWFSPRLKGKARDWNWHNVFGFWSLPLTIILCATGVIIGYRWASDLLYHLAGETPPAAAGRPGITTPKVKMSPPAAEATPLPLEALLEVAQKEYPNWKSIAIQFSQGAPRNEQKPQNAEKPERKDTIQPVSLRVTEDKIIRVSNFAQIFLDPFTGNILHTQTFSDYSTGQKLRIWARWLHTGEALGLFGQILALLGSLAGCFLVWTGFALTWRRFFKRSKAQKRTFSPNLEQVS